MTRADTYIFTSTAITTEEKWEKAKQKRTSRIRKGKIRK